MITPSSTTSYPSLAQRLSFLLINGLLLYGLGIYVTGTAALTGGGEWLWWISGVAYLVLSNLDAPFFVRPRDSLASAIVTASLLATVDLSPVVTLTRTLNLFRWVAFSIAVLTAMAAVTAIALHVVTPNESRWRKSVSRLAYQISVTLGDGALLFTLPALVSIVGFFQDRLASLLLLSTAWIALVTIKPVELLVRMWTIIRAHRSAATPASQVGQLARVDDPNLVRVQLKSTESWRPERLHTVKLPGDRLVEVIPLFFQTQENQLIGTGLSVPVSGSATTDTGQVWTSTSGRTTADLIKELANTDSATELVGFVVEESRIGQIRFEVSNSRTLEEGSVVFLRNRKARVYYQILEAATKEELFTQNPRGTVVVSAGQLGTLNESGAFCKYSWVPEMNTPVFLSGLLKHDSSEDDSDVFEFGSIAQTGLKLRTSLSDMADFHTAVLGVTGTGKTELVFDMIRAHITAGRKVFCVDCTGEYEPRLADLLPMSLGFKDSALEKLDVLVNATEHGTYGAAEEKKALHSWIRENRASVDQVVNEFMTNPEQRLGIFDLPDIANTRATLRSTEMYITAIFDWARARRQAQKVVVVLEEAHTVVPEWNLYRHDKADTDAVVGRMAQIALQGRKYGVGLLLVSQRTALVSKTLLSQCNTCISFTLYDKTGLDYLASVFAFEHVKAIPNLRFLQGLAFGKAIRSDRPIIFDIPEDPKKREASQALNKSLHTVTSPTTETEAVEEVEDDDIPF